MKLNEYLQTILDVSFEDKYNSLAIKEVLDNESEYPNLYPIFKELKDDLDYEGKEISDDYDSSYFELDDIDFVASYEEAYELNKAMTIALLNDVKNKNFKLSSIKFGVGYLKSPNKNCIFHPYLSYRGFKDIVVYKHKTSCFSYKVVNEHHSNKTTNTDYFKDNEFVLRDTRDYLKRINNYHELYEQRFSSEDLLNNEVSLDGNKTYGFDYYGVSINNNYIQFFTTERGFEPLGAIFRNAIVDSLTEEKDDPVVKEIF